MQDLSLNSHKNPLDCVLFVAPFYRKQALDSLKVSNNTTEVGFQPPSAYALNYSLVLNKPFSYHEVRPLQWVSGQTEDRPSMNLQSHLRSEFHKWKEWYSDLYTCQLPFPFISSCLETISFMLKRNLTKQMRHSLTVKDFWGRIHGLFNYVSPVSGTKATEWVQVAIIIIIKIALNWIKSFSVGFCPRSKFFIFQCFKGWEAFLPSAAGKGCCTFQECQ